MKRKKKKFPLHLLIYTIHLKKSVVHVNKYDYNYNYNVKTNTTITTKTPHLLTAVCSQVTLLNRTVRAMAIFVQI